MYTRIDRNLIWLDSFNLSLKKKKQILSVCSMEELLTDFVANQKQIELIVEGPVFSDMQKDANDLYIDKKIAEMEKFDVFAVTQENPQYSELLKNIDYAPLVLYTRGELSLLNKKAIAIVGTRRPTRYGRETAEFFSKKLAEAGLVTVSGLAFGIDTCVAQATIDVNKPTIAVLGGGLDSIYPSQNTFLSQEIVDKGGLLISEYPIGTRPASYSFLERNRIISGLALGTLVVEAGYMSGALATANDAIDQGRELFAIPGNITSSASEGCNKLIRNYPQIFTISPTDILESFDMSSAVEEKAKAVQLSLEETKILDAIGDDEVFVDDIADSTEIYGKTLLSALSALEINGIIKKLPGNYYAKISLPK
ncbi:MAG: DNA-processing protein DprA [Clostridia bacterium]|nr:DNA-processing protein DprA [Clostridia bacterium]